MIRLMSAVRPTRLADMTDDTLLLMDLHNLFVTSYSSPRSPSGGLWRSPNLSSTPLILIGPVIGHNTGGRTAPP